MLTDSRSFLSYTRHEYFRRILCNMIGTDVEKGELPWDFDLLGQTVRDICYGNAAGTSGSRPEEFLARRGGFFLPAPFSFLPEGLLSAPAEARGSGKGRFLCMKIKSLLAIVVSSALVSLVAVAQQGTTGASGSGAGTGNPGGTTTGTTGQRNTSQSGRAMAVPPPIPNAPPPAPQAAPKTAPREIPARQIAPARRREPRRNPCAIRPVCNRACCAAMARPSPRRTTPRPTGTREASTEMARAERFRPMPREPGQEIPRPGHE